MHLNQEALHRIPKMLDPGQLRPGDVLIFNDAVPGKTHQLIQGMQFFQPTVHGHYQNVHVALCVRNEGKGIVEIAHVTGSRNFVIDSKPVEQFSKNTLIVFRPSNVEFAETVAKIASANDNKIQWSITAGLRIWIPKPMMDLVESENSASIETETNCSRFVIEVQKLAESQLRLSRSELKGEWTPKYANLSPMEFENFLRTHHENYENFIIPSLGKEIYNAIRSSVMCKAETLIKQSEGGKIKGEQIIQKVSEFSQLIHADAIGKELDEYQKAVVFIAYLEKALNLQEENFETWLLDLFGIPYTAKTYNQIENFFNAQGIFQEELMIAKIALEDEPTSVYEKAYEELRIGTLLLTGEEAEIEIFSQEESDKSPSVPYFKK
ncbi:MAG: hypothetical protein A3F41_05845 [Coxiella sp. RIFCSPHIGHO2_12_FULL_44_14]|nr:MAG: hypothetical protein A3F41_05845 [Coxiella sp. RIFCSPHIGHO2_12_FULL_44_14]